MLDADQSAVIPYRIYGGELEILLITSSSGKRWVIPKGLIEPGFTACESAIQEAWEEAGVEGDTAEEPVGSYVYRKWGTTFEVLVFLMEVQHISDDWLEADLRTREWVSVDTAARRVKELSLKQILWSLPELLE